MFLDEAIDTKADALEPPKGTDDGDGVEGEEDGLCALGEPSVGEDKVVGEVAGHEDGEPQWG